MLTELEQRALALIDDAELVAWTQALTRINSVWRPELGLGEAEAASWVEARCRDIGLETFVETVQPGRPNVIAVLRGAATCGDEHPLPVPAPGLRGATLMLEGHTDVVTAGDPAAWTDPPFSATLRDGKIFGRGANDMKAGVVCALAALKALRASGARLRGNVLLGAVCDEEGDMIGIKHFVARGWADAVSAAIVCEPEENHLCIEQKGVMWLHATIEGVMAHGAMPLTGVNSAYPMARFLQGMQALEEREIARHGRSPYLGQPSITPTILRSPRPGDGEAQKNVMPARTEVVLDVRLIPGQDPDALAAQANDLLRAAVAVDPRLKGTLEVIEVRAPTRTDRAHPLVMALGGAFTDLTGQPPIHGGVPGSTDGTILNARKGIPIVTCGPGDIHIPHHVDEWVSVAEMSVAARMYVLAALRFLGVEAA
ncbi:MAG: M20 family metallopeptidase [Thermoflexales bacterium]|nr:M20 family metallopeptidase [Thermoflexales bacterium]